MEDLLWSSFRRDCLSAEERSEELGPLDPPRARAARSKLLRPARRSAILAQKASVTPLILVRW